MSAAWVAGGVRARALLARRLGTAGADRLAHTADLDQALAQLADGPYRRGLRPGLALPEIEHAIAASLLWQLRVLAGWQPRAGAEIVRVLAGWFVLTNVIGHVRRLHGAPAEEPYRLGALDAGWSLLAGTASPEQLRAGLSASVWGDPGGTSPAQIALAARLRWASLVAGSVPAAAAWALGAAALVAATAWFACDERPADPAAIRAAAVLGTDPRAAGSLGEFAAAVRPDARWALTGVTNAEDLWRAEAGWWARLTRDGATLVHGSRFGGRQLTGCVALLAADAWRVRAALQVVAAPGAEALAVFDALD